MRVRRRTWGIVAALAVTSASTAMPQPPDTGNRGDIAARIDTFLTRATAHGLSGAILIARHGEIILRKGYGLADRERGTAISPETPFFLGSLAKQFTAAAVLRLEADGKVHLTDSLGTFFPDAPADKRAITVRQLLSHTSGLPYLPTAGMFGRGTRDSVMREMLAERLRFAPGDRYEYSTPGYILLAGVIERASGMSYEQYMRGLFERAKLGSTGFAGERTRWSAAHVRSYTDGAPESSLGDVPAMPRFVGAGSIVSTVDDVFHWYTAVAFGDLLPDAQRRELFSPVIRLRPNLEEALTWMLVALPTGTLRQAAGDIGGFNAELRHYVEEELVVVFASNARVRGRGYREAVMNSVARLTRGDSVPLPPTVVAVAPDDLAPRLGTYTLSDGGTIELWTAGDSILVGALDARGIAALAGHDTSAVRRASDLDDRARRFLQVLDLDTLAQTFMHASIPADARRSYMGKIRAVLGDSASSRGVVVGTAIDSPTEARTYVRFARDSVTEVVRVVWSGGSLVGLAPGGRAAYALSLRGEAPGELAAYDLFTGRLLRIRMPAGHELAIESNGVTRRAVR